MTRNFMIVLTVFMVAIPIQAQDDEQVKKITLAVLPFENITKDSNDNWLSSGFAEQLITGLARVPALKVVERGQLDKVIREQDLQMTDLVDQNQSVKIGQLLSAQKMLIGSYQVVGTRISAVARIVDAETGTVDQDHIIKLEDELDNIFELYDQMIRKITESFGVKLTTKQVSRIEMVKKSGTKSIQAYEFYTKGLSAYHAAQDKKQLKDARDWFKKALKKDKKYVDARKALANTYIKLDELDDAIDEYEKIKKTPDVNEEIYNTLGLFYTIKNKKDKAFEHFELAVKVNPSYPEPYFNLGHLYFYRNEFANALSKFQTAEQLDEDNPEYLYFIAACHIAMNKQYEAYSTLERALENGFSKKERLLKDKVWDGIRLQSKFRELLEEYFE